MLRWRPYCTRYSTVAPFFVFTATLKLFINRHILILIIVTYNCDRLSTKGAEESYRMNYSNRNYTALHVRGHVNATIRNSNDIEEQWKKITQQDSDDAAIVSMEHTLMNWK